MKNPFQVNSPTSVLAGLLAASPAPAAPAEWAVYLADLGNTIQFWRKQIAELLLSRILSMSRLLLELQRAKMDRAA